MLRSFFAARYADFDVKVGDDLVHNSNKQVFSFRKVAGESTPFPRKAG